MFTISSNCQSFKATLVVVLLIGVLSCSRIHSFVQVHASHRQSTLNLATTAGHPLPSVSSASAGSHSSSCRFVGLQGAATDTNEEQDDSYVDEMYNQLSRKRESVRYQIIAAEACEPLARRMAEKYPDRFSFHHTTWAKFPDGTDNIEIGGFSNRRNVISGEKVLFLASFHSNDTTLSQFQVMIYLLQSFIESLTVVLPFSPVGTMERVTQEGQVATAATYAHSESVYLLYSILWK